MEPVGMTAICVTGFSPSRITEPLPNCLSICARASSTAFSRSGPAAIDPIPTFADFAGVFEEPFVTRNTLGAGYDKNSLRGPPMPNPYPGTHDSRTHVRDPHDTP